LTTSALIDLILTHTEEVGATDGENTTLRARVLARAQEIFDRVWSFAEWDFKLTSGSITMTSTGTADLPSTFADFGDNGGVYVSGQRRKVLWLEPRELYKQKEQYAQTAAYPDFYTVNDYTASNSARKITVYPTPTGSFTLNLYYNQVSPTLVDATNSTNNLQALPAEYHYPIMVTGLRYLTGIDNGDGRSRDFDEWFQREMRRMKSRHVFGREQDQLLSQLGGIPSHRSW